MHRVDEIVSNHAGGFAGLLERHVAGRFLDPVIEALSDGRLTISEQSWTRECVSALHIPPGPAQPYRDDMPVVIVRAGGVDMLIDGNNRARKFLQGGGDKFAVLLLEPPC